MNNEAVISLESPLAGRFVRSAPDPWNDAAVTIPETFTPSAVTIPANSALPTAVIVPPTPEAPISNPPLAVTTPTESTLVTSS